ncbi:lecithin retinol acyltransferase family protein [Clostridium baratii]|uniref:lecithin retinol acyltransferase family protein n=1 Tax=Clostridium baratii TaxID=1561 RepID=UPI001CB2CD4A|nr:lecithin retinol acyltransferase family protein [Clostridium baratii]STB71351.1 NC domain [Clostridium baratii]
MSITSRMNYEFLHKEPDEIWCEKIPKSGFHIRVNRGLYYHHGIYISNDEVIHFTGREDDNILDWSKPEVIKTDLKYFLKEGMLEVKEYNDEELNYLYPVEHIIKYARACLGDKGYNLIFNNCEHFANVCTLGKFRSRQVEKVFNAILEGTYKGSEKMSFLGSVGGFFKNLFGGSNGGNRSTSSVSYEPDKARIAEIEADTKLRLAGMEKERVDIMKNARIEILEFETQSNIALEEARAKGLNFMAQTIVAMQEKLNEVAEKRMQIIEKGSLQIVKEIESVYNEFSDRVNADNYKYSEEKLPQLLAVLERYEVGSAAHTLYMKRIEDDMSMQTKHYIMQIDALSKRQSQVIESFLKGKERIIEETNQITEGMLNNIGSEYIGKNKYITDTINEEKCLFEDKNVALLEEKQ